MNSWVSSATRSQNSAARFGGIRACRMMARRSSASCAGMDSAAATERLLKQAGVPVSPGRRRTLV
jgi:hypothetical protein